MNEASFLTRFVFKVSNLSTIPLLNNKLLYFSDFFKFDKAELLELFYNRLLCNSNFLVGKKKFLYSSESYKTSVHMYACELAVIASSHRIFPPPPPSSENIEPSRRERALTLHAHERSPVCLC